LVIRKDAVAKLIFPKFELVINKHKKELFILTRSI